MLLILPVSVVSYVLLLVFVPGVCLLKVLKSFTFSEQSASSLCMYCLRCFVVVVVCVPFPQRSSLHITNQTKATWHLCPRYAILVNNIPTLEAELALERANKITTR